jgi:hypothetical protein
VRLDATPLLDHLVDLLHDALVGELVILTEGCFDGEVEELRVAWFPITLGVEEVQCRPVDWRMLSSSSSDPGDGSGRGGGGGVGDGGDGDGGVGDGRSRGEVAYYLHSFFPNHFHFLISPSLSLSVFKSNYFAWSPRYFPISSFITSVEPPPICITFVSRYNLSTMFLSSLM